MDILTSEALQSVTAAFAALLPADLRPTLIVSPTRVTPTGLGGYVGPSAAPAGDVVGRRLEASAVVVARAANDAQLSEAVNAALSAVLAVDRARLVQQGILQLGLGEIGAAEPQPGVAGRLQRAMSFRLLYEYLKAPTESEGVIAEIPIAVGPDSAPPARRVELRLDLASDPLPLFDVRDDPQANQSRPSQWSYSAAERRVEQRSLIRGGPATNNSPIKAGTYLVLRSDADRPPLRDLTMRATLRSESDGGIGLVFRWQDVDNFYFVLVEQQRNYRTIGRKVGGVFEALATPALDTTQSFTINTPFELTLDVMGDTFRLFVNASLALTGQDTGLPGPGQVGFMARNNNRAFFSELEVLQS